MSLTRSVLVVGVRGAHSSLTRGVHTTVVVMAGDKMGKPDHK